MIDKFLSKISFNKDGCWEWTGWKTHNGYGMLWDGINKKDVRAHRWSYEYYIGPISNGLEIDHICRNRACVNPIHLEPVTTRQNQLRGNGFGGVNSRKTHCPQGHEYTEENTSVRNGKRHCRTCHRERQRERKEANKIRMREFRARQRWEKPV